MSDKLYTYAVARIRSRELSLLTGAFMEQLLSAPGVKECFPLLSERGWQIPQEGTDFEPMLLAEETKTWDLVAISPHPVTGNKVSMGEKWSALWS